MFKYLHNGTYHTDTSSNYMSDLGLDGEAQQGILAQKEFESKLPSPDKVLAKSKGIEHKGVFVSLNESNQNGLSSLKSALELAKEFNVDDQFFPINFNAETAQGVQVVTLENEAEFKQFGLNFILARKAYFE